MAPKLVHSFGKGCEATTEGREILGGKGFGLVAMSNLSLPVPPGFIITTDACRYYRNNKKMSEDANTQIKKAMKTLEEQMTCNFACQKTPLLVSVRSGARVSMPGMMETILNLGLNDANVKEFGVMKGSNRLALDSYRRLIQMYSNVVYGTSSKYFEDVLSFSRACDKVDFDSELSETRLLEICDKFKKIHKDRTQSDFPQDPWVQLSEAVEAVFRSWDNERALAYRAFQGYPDDWGTAVVVQCMVFGNGTNSASGVGFTRDPVNGQKAFYGEYLPNSQGEDVVAGIRTPQSVTKARKSGEGLSLEETMPEVYKELSQTAIKLEKHFKDMQDIEFTIDNNRLFMLQTRSGKRTAASSLKIAFDMLDEKLVEETDALNQINPEQLTQLLCPIFNDKHTASLKVDAKGLNAGPGAGSGIAAFTSDRAKEYAAMGKKSILIRTETSAEDFPGMAASDGILTLRGGATSHAAVVARAIGKPCICACSGVEIVGNTLVGNGKIVNEGDPISIDGTSGHVYFCSVPTMKSEIVRILLENSNGGKKQTSEMYQKFERLMTLSQKYGKLFVRGNCDTEEEAITAAAFGGVGIGLARTEHMFLESHRLLDVRAVFFAHNEATRNKAINKLMSYQIADFEGIFKAMRGKPVTIRLLDPPLHEFLPHTDAERSNTAKHIGISVEELIELGRSLKESNPMLGLRGCRLGITYEQITRMQCAAIFKTACKLIKESKDPKYVVPEIMVPLVGDVKEFVHQKLVIDGVAKEIMEEEKCTINYRVGTMIEVPRACFVAESIVDDGAEFFSFGTNDLTQTCFGISRDDSESYIQKYINGVPKPFGNKDEQFFILHENPFQVLDPKGVGELMHIALSRGKQAKVGKLHTCGICGEHGGDAKSIHTCHELGLDYVSCSPFRIPIARLASAQANIKTLPKK